jgi:drug/metabolite transporter (DMT)-like permease
MRLVVLAIVTLIAFAANSVLNRMAVGSGDIDAISFAIVRLMSGAVALAILVSARGLLQKKPIWPGWSGRFAGCFGLLLYIFSFSLAYISLASGIGALILFGLAQITMFAGAVLARESVPAMRWLGAVVAFSGLIVLVSPFGAAVAFWIC